MSTQPHNFTNANGEVLILRRTGKDMTSLNGYVYPTEIGSTVTAPDWAPTKECGHGLHGWPWGFGIGEGADFDVCNDVFMVVGAKPEDVVGELENGYKCKFRYGVVRFVGGHKGAADFLRQGMTDCVLAMAKSSGYGATNASSGYGAKNASSGYGAKNEAAGTDSTCAAAGFNSRCKVGERGAFALAYTTDDGPRFLCGKVGEHGIKANTWYEVRDGEIKEVQP